MGQPVATVGSQHICPVCKALVIIVEGESNVLINGKPVATIQSICNCGAQIVTGTANILVNGKPIASVGDLTSHGSTIISGSPNVFIYSPLSKSTAVAPIEKIQFPKIRFTDRIINSKGIKEFEKNKKIIEDIAVKSKNTKEESNEKYYSKGWWTDENNITIKESKIGQKVTFNILMNKNKVPVGSKISFKIKDRDKWLNKNDEIPMKGNKSELITDENGKASLEMFLNEQLLDFVIDSKNDEIELYFECEYNNEKKKFKNTSLIVIEKTEIITVLIELPHSTEKGLSRISGGHTGIIIGSEYYDYGPTIDKAEYPYSKGHPWWDQNLGKENLTKKDVLYIINHTKTRNTAEITGKVFLIDIHIKQSERKRIQKWWENKYDNLGHYSSYILFGKQCTTTVKTSLKKSTQVFGYFESTIIVQRPNGLLESLRKEGQHTSGDLKGKPIEIPKPFKEIPYKLN